MNKIINFIKNKKIAFIGLISIFSIVFIFIKVNSSTPNDMKDVIPTSIPSNKVASFNEIVPGKTNTERINELLGYPIESTKSGDLDISGYKTQNQYRNHKVYSQEGLAELIIEEIIDSSKNADDIRKIYGIAPEILYEKTPLSTFNLYIYPSNGIAYLGHKDGTITEIWYFVPATIEDFITKWGSDYSKEPSKEIPKY